MWSRGLCSHRRKSLWGSSQLWSALLSFRSDYRRLIRLSIIGGASALIISDVVARVVLSPQEIPVGIITALVGAPFFQIGLSTVDPAFDHWRRLSLDHFRCGRAGCALTAGNPCGDHHSFGRRSFLSDRTIDG